MLPKQALQALYDSIRLKPFDDCVPRLTVLDGQQRHEALDMAVDEFGRYVDPDSVRPTLKYVNPDLSFGIDANGLLIGAYLVSANSLRTYGPGIPRLDDRPGIQGEALIVHPLTRGKGYGHVLRNLLPEVGRIVGADYVWGGALVELDNLNHWLRRRVLIRTGAVHITCEPIASDLKRAMLPLAGGHLREKWIAELGMETPSDELPFSSSSP